MGNTAKKQVSKKAYIAYCLFFLGQNILWGYAGFIETFMTDIGFAAATAGAILLFPKIWDAVNDVLFGYLMDRFCFKNGDKFIPWIRIGTCAIGITTVALFAIPKDMTSTAKIVWFLLAYILFDASYTILDAPAFAVTTVMTSDVDERTSVIAGGKLWAMVGGVIATVLIPSLRPRLGGWFTACIVFVAVSVGLMVPMLFHVKEQKFEYIAGAENPKFKDIFRYLTHNRFLIVALLALLLLGLSSVEQKMVIYMSRYCFGGESMGTPLAAGVAVSVILVSIFVPILSKKIDKFFILCFGLAFAIVMDVITYFVGYSNWIVALVMTMLKCTGLGFWQVIIYMLIADTVEYGAYKSGTKAAGMSFSLQTFVAKLKNAVLGSLILFSMAAIGFVEKEDAVQPVGFSDRLWGLFCLLPAAGFAVALIILLLFYKLRTKDVKIMAEYNNGGLSRDEAEAQLKDRYGEAYRG